MSRSPLALGRSRASLVAASLGPLAWLALASLAPGQAAGQEPPPPCDLDSGETLYIAGPDSMINVLRNVAAELWDEDIHILYKGYPSCLGIENLVNNAIKYSPDGGAVEVAVALEGEQGVANGGFARAKLPR